MSVVRQGLVPRLLFGRVSTLRAGGVNSVTNFGKNKAGDRVA